MVTSPRRRSRWASSAAIRKPSTGRVASAARVSPGVAMPPSAIPLSAGPKRASAQAAPGVSASPRRDSTPRPVSRAAISSMSAASPPKRWAQPLMSSSNPSSPSTAHQGVKRLHQRASRSSPRRSAAGSAFAVTRPAVRARASARRMPGLSPCAPASRLSAHSTGPRRPGVDQREGERCGRPPGRPPSRRRARGAGAGACPRSRPAQPLAA